MFLMLTISFVIIFILSDISAKALSKYPAVNDCSQLLGYEHPEEMEKYAILEHRTNSALESSGSTVSYTKGYV